MTFKPQLENLEDRVALDGYIGSHLLYQDVVIPKVTSTISGRVTAIAVDPSDPSGNSYYIGSANGGVWKTTDGGATWAGGSQIGSLTDFVVGHFNESASIFDSRPGTGILKSI